MRWWYGALAVVGAIGAGAAVGLASRRRRGLAGWREDYAAPSADKDVLERRARGAGARGELTFVGAGAEGITLCDAHGKAYKIGRHSDAARRGTAPTLRDEAAWMAMAGKIASLAPHVPRGVRYDADNDVIVRECLVARSGSRANGKRLWDLHQRLTSTMAPYGHGRPEFKIDSYVYTRRGPVLVDAGFAVKRGDKLVKDALDVINDRVPANRSEVEEMAWALRMERDETIPASVANKLLVRLKQLVPTVEL